LGRVLEGLSFGHLAKVSKALLDLELFSCDLLVFLSMNDKNEVISIYFSILIDLFQGFICQLSLERRIVDIEKSNNVQKEARN
jgi:hypothetical protein